MTSEILKQQPDILSADSNINRRRGILWAALCSAMFSLLPFFSQQALSQYSSLDVAWLRLSFAAFFLCVWLVFKGQFNIKIASGSLVSVFIAGFLLACNFVGYTKGVELSGAANAQMLIQLAQLSLVLIGIFFFKERLNRLQLLGLVLAFLGLYLFISERSGSSLDSISYNKANWYLVVGSVSWGVYASIQKVLSLKGAIQLFNCLILAAAALIILPTVEFNNFSAVFTFPTFMLFGVAVVSLIAYVALAQALAYTSATLVSALIVLNPIGTFAILYLLGSLGVGVSSSELLSFKGLISAMVALLGVVLVVSAKPSNNAAKI